MKQIYYLVYVFNLLLKFLNMKKKYQKLKLGKIFLDVNNVKVILIINIIYPIQHKINKLLFVIYANMKMN